MIRLYTPQRVLALIRELSPFIGKISAEYGVPGECVKAVLYREMKEIDLLDAAADAAVRFGWFGKTDCSTGYAQIFSYVAIRALDFAEKRGIETAENLGIARPLSENNPEDVRRIWLRLNEDREFNVRMGTLNLLAAADEVVGNTDFPRFTEEELKKVFSRYNANTRRITAYGREVYGYYLRFGTETADA